MIRVGLTGGIAAGKSVASTEFRRLGVSVIDYDQLSRVVVEPGTRGLAAVVAEFGEQMLHEDGTLNRARLAQRIFGDDDARERLEEIVHPLIIEQAQRLDGEAEARSEKMIVHDIPLLVEVAGSEIFDAVIVVDAPPELRVSRLVADRGVTEDEAWARIDAQIDDDVRLASADVVFDGSGEPDNLRGQVERWVDKALTKGVHYRPNSERTSFLATEDGLE